MAEDRLDPERQLALSYVTPRRRASLSALWNLDAAIGAAVAAGSQPLVKSIKLAWWRERLDELGMVPVPAEPVLDGVARHLLTAGVEGRRLAVMTEGWDVLAGAETLGSAEFDRYAELRGGVLFRLSARLLGGDDADPAVAAAGKGWALADFARRASDAAEAAAALEVAARQLERAAIRWPSHLRPLGMLAVLAGRDVKADAGRLERPGSPARMLRMLAHRITGR